MSNETKKVGGGHPIKTNGYTQVKRNAIKSRKRNEAIDRQVEHDGLTLSEKIQKATLRGGSKKELARLMKQQKNAPAVARIQPVAPVVAPVAVEAKKKVKKSDVVKAAKAARPAKS